MNYARILLGGIVGGVAFNIVSFAINVGILGSRYAMLQEMGIFRKDPRVPFLPLWLLMLFLVSIGLVWFYAAVRPRLGPGPKTALTVGLLVGLLGALPRNFSGFAWAYTGGYLALFWTLDMVVGCMAATFVGAWLYKE